VAATAAWASVGSKVIGSPRARWRGAS
jgi:hypothetical protein